MGYLHIFTISTGAGFLPSTVVNQLISFSQGCRRSPHLKNIQKLQGQGEPLTLPKQHVGLPVVQLLKQKFTGLRIPRWWFQIFCIFTPIWGRFPF